MPHPLAAFALLLGHWTDGATSEQWVDVGHAWFGVGFAPGSDGTTFEFLRIHEVDGEIRYTAMPGGGPPVPFALAELDGRRFVFANPEHDFPQRIRYDVRGRRLEAGIGLLDGPDRATFRLRRRPAPDATALVEADRAFAAAVATAPPGAARVDAWIGWFHPDGWMVDAERGRIERGDAMREAVAPVHEGTLAWTPIEGGMAAAGDLGFTVGAWTWTAPDAPSPASRGSYVTVWRQDADGRWRVLFDTGERDPRPSE